MKEFYDLLETCSLWTRGNTFLKNVIHRSFYEFCLDYKLMLDAYFEEKLELNKLASAYSSFLFKNQTQFKISKKELINSFQIAEQHIDTALNNTLSKYFFQKKEINILGFGADSGQYEKKSGDFLKSQGLIEQYQLYIYDPYFPTHQRPSNCIYIDNLDTPLPKFDLILSRWVLHHVHHKNRWENFLKLTNQISDTGLILILEEGDLKSEYTEKYKANYELLLMFIDVFINFFLRPTWLVDNKKEPASSFFLSYLNQTQLQNLIGSINYKVETHMNQFDKTCQFLISLSPVKLKQK